MTYTYVYSWVISVIYPLLDVAACGLCIWGFCRTRFKWAFAFMLIGDIFSFVHGSIHLTYGVLYTFHIPYPTWLLPLDLVCEPISIILNFIGFISLINDLVRSASVPNNALQRTGIGGRVGSEFEP